MPHKKFPRMSQAQLKRLIKSQNQNLEKAACILEPPKIIQQPLIGQLIITPNAAYAKKQRKTGARPNPGRAGKVPMQVLVEHVEQEDHVEQNPSIQTMLTHQQETSKQEKPNQQDEVFSEKCHAVQIPQQYSSELAKEQDGAHSVDLNGGNTSLKEGASGYQTGWYWQSGNVLGERQELPGISSASSASFNWPSQADKSQGTSGTNQSPSDPFSMQNLKKIAQDFFSYPECYPLAASVDGTETTEAEPEDAGALNLSIDNFSISEPLETETQPVPNSSPVGSVLDANRSNQSQLSADGTMRRQQEYPLEEAFMSIIQNLSDTYPADNQLDSSSYFSNIPYDGYQSQPGYGNDPNSYFTTQSTMTVPSAYSRPSPTGFSMNQQPEVVPKYNQLQQAQTPSYHQSPDYETYQRQTQQHWPVYLPEYVSQFMFGEPQDSNARNPK
ncbi:uncharacterized protein LOC6549842 isoform X1 [Drosophila erecta]|uniref:Uncharacterized protein n=1 Tax=Drosophila erecta TaxID=7220 RepID=B3NWV3_DROER|nr:uncharacterized protein LOC6549842 isoform X1 [Drosophila erecta]EDV46500.2 uncharacterized protein Dere_GG19119 [Drosophila erecta]